MPPRWLPTLLVRIRGLASAGHVAFTHKALRELAQLGIGLDEDDACDILCHLHAPDFSERVKSESTGEWLYVFKPEVAGTAIYLKVVLRNACIVISLHEDHEAQHDQGEE